MTRRAALLGTAQLGLMGVLGWRMKQLQIDQAEEFRLLAEENRINMRLIPPPRGLIFDRNGVPLATNEPVYRIVIVREAAGDPQEALARLAAVMPLDPEDIERSLAAGCDAHLTKPIKKQVLLDALAARLAGARS